MFHFNIRADPMSSIGDVVVRQIPSIGFCMFEETIFSMEQKTIQLQPILIKK